MISTGRVREARQRIEGHIVHTPVTFDQNLNCYIKWENHQITGSFKLRGALNHILSIKENEIHKGFVTCSAGNHGQGVAYAAGPKGGRCIVFASEQAAEVKLAAMQKLGAELRLVKGAYVEAEQAAITFAKENGSIFISPYNGETVICGQGTLAMELGEDLDGFTSVQAVIVPVGGGGLLSGIGTYMGSLGVRPALVGVQSEASSFAYQLNKTGSQEGVVETDSIAEGLAGEIDHNSITIPLIQQYAEDIVLVSEDETRVAIRYAWEKHHEIIEGSAAVGLAACLTGKITTLPAVIVVTGGNIQPELHSRILLDH